MEARDVAGLMLIGTVCLTILGGIAIAFVIAL